jgi:sulfite reductase beta subunit-like hemoprotein
MMAERRAQPAPTWELVRKRNYVERLKHEKAPLDVIHDLPDLIASGYEAVNEEDIVRLQWYGLYHDKPKVGSFMMRVKVPSGILTPHKLRTIGHLSTKFGRNFGELTTRQNIQLHYIELSYLPEMLETLEQAGLTMLGGCGDTVRNITGCPVAGLAHDEYFDTTPVIEEAASFFYGNRDYADLPRKHKITISACAHQCNAPEINCISLVGVVKDGQPGFAVRVGGGLSTWPRLSDDLGVWVPVDSTLPVLRAIIDVWKEDLKYRMSRVKARMKFMVHDVGPEGYRELVEARLGYRLEDGQLPEAVDEYDHTGIHAQKEPGLFYAGFPVSLGLCSGRQMIALADLAESYGGDIRLTRRQNFILTGIPEERLDEVIRAVEGIGFPLHANGLRASAIACTGEPFCNYSVAETKSKLEEIVDHLEGLFGDEVAGMRLNLDGCPHACAQHWIGDIGLQGTTLRERGPAGERLRGYEIYLRGGLGRQAAIGRAVIRRVPSEDVHRYVERLVRAHLTSRQGGESMQAFFTRHSDEELLAIASGSHAPASDEAALSAAG